MSSSIWHWFRVKRFGLHLWAARHKQSLDDVIPQTSERLQYGRSASSIDCCDCCGLQLCLCFCFLCSNDEFSWWQITFWAGKQGLNNSSFGGVDRVWMWRSFASRIKSTGGVKTDERICAGKRERTNAARGCRMILLPSAASLMPVWGNEVQRADICVHLGPFEVTFLCSPSYLKLFFPAFHDPRASPRRSLCFGPLTNAQINYQPR